MGVTDSCIADLLKGERSLSIERTGAQIESLVRSETLATTVCPGQCAFVSGRGPAFVRQLSEAKLWPLDTLRQQPLGQIFSQCVNFFLLDTGLPTCSGRQRLYCGFMNMTSSRNLAKAVRNIGWKV